MFNTILSTTLSLYTVSICILVSIICGMIISLIYKCCAQPGKSFAITVALLPLMVQIVIMMVNGNLGAGVAVAGAFSLVRFRSLPGKASDIATVFFAMSIGLATGMGYIAFALLATVVIGILYIILFNTEILDSGSEYRSLKITIPEDLDYSDVFDDLFKKYTYMSKLKVVKTINLGSMFQLIYDVKLKNIKKEKKFIDELRVRNGNLSIISSRMAVSNEEL